MLPVKEKVPVSGSYNSAVLKPGRGWAGAPHSQVAGVRKLAGDGIVKLGQTECVWLCSARQQHLPVEQRGRGVIKLRFQHLAGGREFAGCDVVYFGAGKCLSVRAARSARNENLERPWQGRGGRVGT